MHSFHVSLRACPQDLAKHSLKSIRGEGFACLLAGTLCHQLGQQSFQRLPGADPLDGVLQARGASQSSPEQKIYKELHRQTREIRRRNRDQEAAYLASAKERYADSVADVENVLHNRRILKEMGSWLSVPHRCPTLLLQTKASDACETFLQNADETGRGMQTKLCQKWQERHLGVRAPAPKRRVRGIYRSECWQQGCCLCGTAARRFANQATSVLRTACKDAPHAHSLLNAFMVLLWVGGKQAISADIDLSNNDVVHRVTYIPLHYLKPWRPTFVEVKLQQSLQSFLQSLPRRAGLHSDASLWHTLSLVDPAGGELPFLTPFAFAKTLDLSLHWSVLLLELSTRKTPFIGSAGLVRARVSSANFLQIWPQDVHQRVDVFDMEEENDAGEAADPLQDEAGPEDPLPAQEDIESDSVSSQSGLACGLSSSSDSSTSNRSQRSMARQHSTSESDGSDVEIENLEGNRRRNENNNDDNNNQPVPDLQEAAPVPARLDAGLQRQRRPDSFSWGAGFFFTRRLHPPGWQILCRYHRDGAAACTKTSSCSDEQAGSVIRRMKSWALNAPTHETKASHQGRRGLPAESAEHERLSDEQLDELVGRLPPPG